MVRFRVYAFKNNQGLHGRCFSLGHLADIIVDGDAGAHSAAKKKSGVQVVLGTVHPGATGGGGHVAIREGIRTHDKAAGRMHVCDHGGGRG